MGCQCRGMERTDIRDLRQAGSGEVMNDTDKKLLKLAVLLLNEMSNHYGNHGCNDMDQEILARCRFNEKEKADLSRDFDAWNENEPGDYHEFDRIPDFEWMDFIADRLAPYAAL